MRHISIRFHVVIMLALTMTMSCKHSLSNTTSSESIENIQETTTVFPQLPEAPVITYSYARKAKAKLFTFDHKDNGYTAFYERKAKTMAITGVVPAAESTIPLANDYDEYRAPSLVFLKRISSSITYPDYWATHNVDTAAAGELFNPIISELFNCCFNDDSKRELLSSSCPIEIKDTLAFNPIIKLVDSKDGRIYSPLFECFFRERPMLVCTFDLDSLTATRSGLYMWDIIRNYTYSDYFRNDLKHNVKTMSDDIWYETLYPDYRK